MEKIKNFAELGLSSNILKALEKKGFEEPTPIQAKIIPLLLKENQDVVGQAQTGTGKTAAFGIPILEKLQSNVKHVQAIILVPTRELAIQVAEEISSFKGDKKFVIAPIYGGQSIQQQLIRLKKGVDIVVGTPGRILDHLNRKRLKLSDITYLILDEADEMLNMGFIEDVNKIIECTNPDRSTLLFSATMPKEITQIAKKYMKNFEKVAITEKQVEVNLTDQIYFEVSEKDKFEALCRIIDIEDDFYGLVFCRTRVDVDRITSKLLDRGYEAEGLHGEITQSQRITILNKFRNKRVNILVATDVAARGIDIENLTHVINHTIPQDPNAYVHRIGRTGRAGKEGTAITFVTSEEYRKLRFIQRIAKTDIRKEKLPKVKEIITAKRNKILDDIRQIEPESIEKEYLKMARELIYGNDPEETLASLLKYTFQDDLNPQNYNEIRDGSPKIQGKTRLFVAKGKKDGMHKRELVRFIKKKANVDDRKIDNVEVFDAYSFITVPFREAEKIMACFQKSHRGKRSIVEVAKEDKGKKRK